MLFNNYDKEKKQDVFIDVIKIREVSFSDKCPIIYKLVYVNVHSYLCLIINLNVFNYLFDVKVFTDITYSYCWIEHETVIMLVFSVKNRIFILYMVQAITPFTFYGIKATSTTDFCRDINAMFQTQIQSGSDCISRSKWKFSFRRRVWPCWWNGQIFDSTDKGYLVWDCVFNESFHRNVVGKNHGRERVTYNFCLL